MRVNLAFKTVYTRMYKESPQYTRTLEILYTSRRVRLIYFAVGVDTLSILDKNQLSLG